MTQHVSVHYYFLLLDVFHCRDIQAHLVLLYFTLLSFTHCVFYCFFFFFNKLKVCGNAVLSNDG